MTAHPAPSQFSTRVVDTAAPTKASAVPTAVHHVGPAHETEPSSETAGPGLSTTDHALPSQRSVDADSAGVCPTPMHCVVLVHDTLNSPAPAETYDHVAPFHVAVTAPTATQSESDTQLTASSCAPLTGLGVSTGDHFDPSQVSMSVAVALDPDELPESDDPTATQNDALTHETATRFDCAERPPGTLT